MKRVGNLMERITDMENLREAFLRASKGKTDKLAVVSFRKNLDDNLKTLGLQLMHGNPKVGKYHFFKIHDPKERIICAAQFPTRVAFHAIMRICHPLFDAYQIYDSYASRIGKGQYKAIERARGFASKYRWFAKLDVCKYFDSIDHEVMTRQIGNLIKDRRLMDIFKQLIDGYCREEGKGLPIGNLTSQYFANHYLSLADHYIKEKMSVKAYVRYMDDMLIFANDKEEIKHIVKNYTTFIERTLILQLHQPVINKTNKGLNFLGYVVTDKALRLSQRSRRRFRKKLANLDKEYQQSKISIEKYNMRYKCLRAFIDKAEAMAFLKSSWTARIESDRAPTA